jgi:hypothetical protein
MGQTYRPIDDDIGFSRHHTLEAISVSPGSGGDCELVGSRKFRDLFLTLSSITEPEFFSAIFHRHKLNVVNVHYLFLWRGHANFVQFIRQKNILVSIIQ